MHPSCPAITDCCDWQPFAPCQLPKLGLTPAVCACRCVNVLSINIWGEFDYPGRQLSCRSCMQTRISFVLATLEHAHQGSQACPDCLLAALKDVTTKARLFKSCRSCSHCHKFVTAASGRSYGHHLLEHQSFQRACLLHSFLHWGILTGKHADPPMNQLDWDKMILSGADNSCCSNTGTPGGNHDELEQGPESCLSSLHAVMH